MRLVELRWPVTDPSAAAALADVRSRDCHVPSEVRGRVLAAEEKRDGDPERSVALALNRRSRMERTVRGFDRPHRRSPCASSRITIHRHAVRPQGMRSQCCRWRESQDCLTAPVARENWRSARSAKQRAPMSLTRWAAGPRVRGARDLDGIVLDLSAIASRGAPGHLRRCDATSMLQGIGAVHRDLRRLGSPSLIPCPLSCTMRRFVPRITMRSISRSPVGLRRVRAFAKEVGCRVSVTAHSKSTRSNAP